MRKKLPGSIGLFTSLFLFLFVCGCVRTVTKDDLNDLGMEHAATGFPERTYYTGSEGNYDYFVVRRDSGGAGHRYRVRKAEGAVSARFGRTKDETEWREYGSELVVTNGGRISR